MTFGQYTGTGGAAVAAESKPEMLPSPWFSRGRAVRMSLKLHVREDGSEFVQRSLEAQDAPVPVVDILHFEFFNALRLKVFRGELDSATADDLIALFEDRLFRGQYVATEVDRDRMMSDFQTLSKHTETLGCRTVDILHVAAALQLRPRRFITFDNRQARLAVLAELTVETGSA